MIGKKIALYSEGRVLLRISAKVKSQISLVANYRIDVEVHIASNLCCGFQKNSIMNYFLYEQLQLTWVVDIKTALFSRVLDWVWKASRSVCTVKSINPSPGKVCGCHRPQLGVGISILCKRWNHLARWYCALKYRPRTWRLCQDIQEFRWDEDTHINMGSRDMFILPSCKSKSSQSFHRPIIPFPWINLLNIGWTHSPVSLNPPPPNLPTGNSTNPGSLNALGSRIVSPTRVDFEMETLFIPLYSRLFCCAVLDL